MNPDDKSKIQSFLNDLEGLKSRTATESKYKDWKEKVEKKLEEVFGKGSDQLNRFQRVKPYNFTRPGKPKDAPLTEEEFRELVGRLDEAKRMLQRFI
ncbi:MAG: hypothetical protein AB1798_22790 [Spirochaetota bacterium]